MPKVDQLLRAAIDLHHKGNIAEAKFIYEKIIQLVPQHADALHLLGVVAYQRRQYQISVDLIGKAIVLAPTLADAFYNRGNALTELDRLEDAIRDYEKAIALKPNYASAFYNRGNALAKLKRYNDAIEDYNKAVALRPNHALTLNNRGIALAELRRLDDAVNDYDKAIALEPNYAGAFNNRGSTLTELKRLENAVRDYDKAFSLDPTIINLEAQRLHTRMMMCAWQDFADGTSHLLQTIRTGKVRISPFPILALYDQPEIHRLCAEGWSASYPSEPRSPRKHSAHQHNKMRIGYVSTDFKEHAVAYLISELLELHDRARFEILGYSLGPDENSIIRRRLQSSFDRFIDCRFLSDEFVARDIADKKIDILVDLNGFTSGARTKIFAQRPAPIQANYLGYPGTMGASYVDYIIGDRTLFSAVDAGYYAERLVQLPHTYLPNDRKRKPSDKIFTRQELGLPEDGFVFWCMHNNYKILPSVFDCWMRLLCEIKGSVLWLLGDNASAVSNLRKEAQQRGVDPQRLVFADRMDLPDHLARHRLADLFLDTLPYNACTTASDALWSGLPVLTQMGESFASRMAASLLNALDVPELITHSGEEYVKLAIELARNPEKLKAIRDKIAAHRLTKPLFDTPLYTKHLEAAYEAMYRRYQEGLPPDHITVDEVVS